MGGACTVTGMKNAYSNFYQEIKGTGLFGGLGADWKMI
jgi:hypothetical protein